MKDSVRKIAKDGETKDDVEECPFFCLLVIIEGIKLFELPRAG